VSDLAAPPDALIRSGWLPFLQEFYRRAFQLWQQLPPGRTLLSWYRTPERNRIEGGSDESQHLFALAMDFGIPGLVAGIEAEAPERSEFTITELARFAGLIAVPKRGSVHVQLFPAGALARAGVRFPRG